MALLHGRSSRINSRQSSTVIFISRRQRLHDRERCTFMTFQLKGALYDNVGDRQNAQAWMAKVYGVVRWRCAMLRAFTLLVFEFSYRTLTLRAKQWFGVLLVVSAKAFIHIVHYPVLRRYLRVTWLVVKIQQSNLLYASSYTLLNRWQR